MKEEARRILAMGGGGFSTSVADAPLERYIAGLPRVDQPRICLLPTASGDPDDQIDRFHRAFRGLGRLSHLSLFRLGTHPISPPEHLLAQDVIYVGGGSLAQPARHLARARARPTPSARRGSAASCSAG